MLGGHVASLPERTLAEEACDFVSSDEALHTVVDLLTAFKASPEPDLSRVRGLVYRDHGQSRVRNAAAPLVKDLDGEMPGVAWDLLPMTRYRAHNWHCFGDLEREPYAAIYTTLGCPYRCSFCCIQAPFKAGEQMMGLRAEANSYRFWSPARVVEEIDLLVTKYGVRNIKFADEMFVLNQRHVIGICDLLIERGYDLNIWAYARVDTVKDNMLDKLKRAGFSWLALGIEAADDRVLTDVDKRYEVDEVYDTVRRIKDAGINIIGNYIFGLPEDTPRRCSGRSIWRSISTASSRTSIPRWRIPDRRCTKKRFGAAGGCQTPGAAIRSTRSTRFRCRRATSRPARC